MSVDLEEATFEQILGELASRHTGVLVAYVGKDFSDVTGKEVFEASWRGGHTLAVGLAEKARSRILAGNDDGSKE